MLSPLRSTEAGRQGPPHLPSLFRWLWDIPAPGLLYLSLLVLPFLLSLKVLEHPGLKTSSSCPHPKSRHKILIP